MREGPGVLPRFTTHFCPSTCTTQLRLRSRLPPHGHWTGAGPQRGVPWPLALGAGSERPGQSQHSRADGAPHPAVLSEGEGGGTPLPRVLARELGLSPSSTSPLFSVFFCLVLFLSEIHSVYQLRLTEPSGLVSRVPVTFHGCEDGSFRVSCAPGGAGGQSAWLLLRAWSRAQPAAGWGWWSSW